MLARGRDISRCVVFVTKGFYSFSTLISKGAREENSKLSEGHEALLSYPEDYIVTTGYPTYRVLGPMGMHPQERLPSLALYIMQCIEAHGAGGRGIGGWM